MTTKKTKNIDCTHTIDEYIYKFDWRIKANANSGYSAAGLINNISGKVIANYWLEAVYSEESANMHREGAIHIHDLDCLTPYCSGWSLRKLLDEGFNGVRGRTQSSAPNHFSVALGQMANFMGILQSEWAGAQAFSSFDTYLAPYVFKDKLSYKEVKKNIRQFIFNMNVPSRWGQSPFTNVTIDWTVPDDLKNQFPTRNGIHLFTDLKDDYLLNQAKVRDNTIESLADMIFKHFQPEIDLINRAFYEILTEGDRDGQPFTFPIPTVNITEDFDWYNPNTKYLFENTAKIGSSYFSNYIGNQYIIDADGNKIKDPKAYSPKDVRSLCCRLRLDLKELYKRGNGLFGSGELTGSIGVVTINMARLGYIHKGNKENLIKELDYLMGIAEDTLERKRIFVKQQYESGLYPFTKRYLKTFDHHFSTIGVNGMNEMIRNFTNDEYNIADERGIKFSLEILDHIREKLHKFQNETGNLYNLEATPGEGTCYRFAKEDKKKYHDILQAGFGKHIYYTNSSQLPVSLTDDPFEALRLQDDLQCKYTGGTVFHLYMREKIEDAEVCKKLIKTILTNFKMPYITITPIFSICSKHGYLSGEHEYCPECDKELLKQEYLIS
jgi:ribonucleoside-triphosphate reductase